MKKLVFVLCCLLTSCQQYGGTIHSKNSRLPVWHPDYRTAYTASYKSGEPEEEELKDVQCPIPMKDRVRNGTGSQCVFSSLEMLGRWAEEPKITEPPLTSRQGCRSFSGPDDASGKLKKFGVKFENSYRDREKGIELIKKAMAEGRGALFGVPGHAMVIIHYDEEKNVVKWVDNSDSSLRVQTMTVEKFKKRWDSWVMVIYADKDIIAQKLNRVSSLIQQIPIVDRNNPQGQYPKDYIPIPQRDK